MRNKVVEGEIEDLVTAVQTKTRTDIWEVQELADALFMMLGICCLNDRMVRLTLPNGRRINVRLEG